jgi:hypothetical protein
MAKTPLGAYYTTTEEEDPVFHVWSNCPEGEKIEDKNKKRTLLDRHFCEACARMNPKP